MTYQPSESEGWILTHIRDLWPSETEERRSSFLQTLLMRRLDSSFYAFEQTVRRLMARETIVGAESESEMETGDDLDDDAVPQAMRLNREVGERIVAALENERSDSKWEACQPLLESRGIGDRFSGIIFTEFADTAEYLSYLVSSRGWTSILMTGAQTMEERESGLIRAREEKGILVATSLVDTGPSLGFANEVIHYDLPWNPARLLQRCGHVERVGCGFPLPCEHTEWGRVTIAKGAHREPDIFGSPWNTFALRLRAGVRWVLHRRSLCSKQTKSAQHRRGLAICIPTPKEPRP